MFADLVADEVVDRSPCVLTRTELGANIDKDPEWRTGAIFDREEAELLISHDEIPEDRRVLYGTLFLTGMRYGEVAGLRFRHIDTTLRPLHRITVAHSYEGRTKSNLTRQVPVHPTLAAMLAEWRLGGYARLTGGPPKADAFVLPHAKGGIRSRHRARKDFLRDLDLLKLRHRRLHDTRRTFISLAQAAGARKDILEHITHGPRGNIMHVYTTLPWDALCEAVACLQIRRRDVGVGS